MIRRDSFAGSGNGTVGYIRRSTDKQEQSIEDQKNAISAYVAENGLRFLRFYVDDAISGTSTLGRHVCIVFTTTKTGESSLFDDQIDAHPLLSRCAKIELTNQGLAKPFAEHCQRIADNENLNGKPIQSYIKLAQNCKNNCREMLMAIESGDMLA